MPELVQSALSALRHLRPDTRAAALAILGMWAHAAQIDVDQVVDYYFTGGRTDVTVVAGGRLVSHCCGRIDDDPHRNFCEHYLPVGGLDCPEWCTVDHAEDDDRDDLVLHQGADHVDGSVRKLLDPHQLDVRVSRTDLPAEGAIGVPALYVRAEVEITTWQQAAELSRVILDSFGYLEDGAL